MVNTPMIVSSSNNGRTCQSNLVKGDIVRLTMTTKSCRYLLSYSPGGSTRREFGPGGCIWGPLFERMGGDKGSEMLPFERAIVVHCDHCAISNHSATICHRMSLTLKSKGVGQF